MDENIDFNKNIEIEEEIKKFQEQKQEDKRHKQPLAEVYVNPDDSKMVQFFIKNKLVKNSKQANAILFFLALIMFLLSAYFFLNGTKTTITTNNPPSLPAIHN